jgi:AcrR family transcriptional regulator
MPDSGPYHHGDLRSALLQAARAEVEDNGYESLSLRRLASLTGVSHAAPYRHFRNRDELLLELALEGVRWLATAYEAAEALAPLERLRDITRSYLRLSVERPQLFRLMFVSELVKREPFKSRWTEASNPAFSAFRRAVQAAHPQAGPEEIEVIQLRWWSTKHGLALLHMTGRFDRFPKGGRSDDHFIEAVIASLKSSD